MRNASFLIAMLSVAGCTTGAAIESAANMPQAEIAAVEDADPMDALISEYAAANDVPEALVHRVVKRESTYNPQAKNGGHYGLMQIKPETVSVKVTANPSGSLRTTLPDT